MKQKTKVNFQSPQWPAKPNLGAVSAFRCFGVSAFVATLCVAGCVRRTMKITSEPPNALVVLNDQEIGRTEVTTDFLWYGDYDVVLRKEGYQTLQTNWRVKAPWYQVPPLDFFFEVLWPGKLHHQTSQHFVMVPEQLPTADEVAGRADKMREATVNPTPTDR